MSIIAEKPHKNHLNNLDNLDLENLLIKNLPTKTRAGSHKAILTGKRYPSYWAVHKCPFIEYNSPKSVSITVLDFDWITKPTEEDQKGETVKDRFKSAYHFNKYFLSEYLEVNFILETEKGFQAFIIWNSRINKDFWSSWNLLQHVKKGFIEKIPFIDPVATSRNKGVFRNPLKHKNLILSLEPFSLYDFKEDFTANDTKKEIKAKLEPVKKRETTEKEKSVHQEVKYYVKKVLLDEFEEIPEGFRETTLFQLAVIKARKIKDLDKYLFEYLFFINKKYCLMELDVSQLNSIVNIVKKYKAENTLTVKNPLKSDNWEEKPRKEINKDYYKKHKGAKTMTRKENLTQINKKRAEEKERKVRHLLSGVFYEDYQYKSSKKWNITRIANELNISKDTVKKYLPKELK
jgi:hypothetical protein